MNWLPFVGFILYITIDGLRNDFAISKEYDLALKFLLKRDGYGTVYGLTK